MNNAAFWLWLERRVGFLSRKFPVVQHPSSPFLLFRLPLDLRNHLPYNCSFGIVVVDAPGDGIQYQALDLVVAVVFGLANRDVADGFAGALKQLVRIFQKATLIEAQVQMLGINRNVAITVGEFQGGSEDAGEGVGVVKQFVAIGVEIDDPGPQIQKQSLQFLVVTVEQGGKIRM